MGTCPECGSHNVSRSQIQYIEVTEKWAGDQLLDYWLGEWGEIVRVTGYRCRGCGRASQPGEDWEV